MIYFLPANQMSVYQYGRIVPTLVISILDNATEFALKPQNPVFNAINLIVLGCIRILSEKSADLKEMIRRGFDLHLFFGYQSRAV